ncbi:MAG: hypothetical protein II733_02145 [Succinivibrio sp.]|nr:hypothetical protein [Succinivibrio sp.]
MEKLLPVERKINYKGYAFILLCIVISFVFILLCSVFIRNGSIQNQVKKSDEVKLSDNAIVSDQLLRRLKDTKEVKDEIPLKEEEIKVEAKNTQNNEDFYRSYVQYKEKNHLLDRDLEDTSLKEDEKITQVKETPLKSSDNSSSVTGSSDNEKIVSAVNSKTRVELSNGTNSLIKNDIKKTDEDSEELNEDNPLNDYSVFERKNFKLKEKVKKLSSPFVLMQGTLIKAVMLTAVNSEIPGQVRAMVTQDVYDTVSHQYLLLPKGSTLLGQYATAAAYGSERLFLGFSRLIFPDGSSLNLGAMPGSSSDGSAGLTADVDNHFFRIIMNSMLLSSITAASDSVQAHHSDAKGNTTFGSRAASSNASNLSTTFTRLIDKNINMSPTLNVKAGFPFSISITKDIYFDNPY